jgi:hypothetical protein
MSRLKYLNPFWIRSVVRNARRAAGGGGPRLVRIARVRQPKGLILPTAELDIEVVTRKGTTETFTAPVPVPWPAAWTYRLARALGAPVVSSLGPEEEIGLSVPVPRRGR